MKQHLFINLLTFKKSKIYYSFVAKVSAQLKVFRFYFVDATIGAQFFKIDKLTI